MVLDGFDAGLGVVEGEAAEEEEGEVCSVGDCCICFAFFWVFFCGFV